MSRGFKLLGNTQGFSESDSLATGFNGFPPRSEDRSQLPGILKGYLKALEAPSLVKADGAGRLMGLSGAKAKIGYIRSSRGVS
jgi:hypothetical protein